jgi:hypothetical protein
MFDIWGFSSEPNIIIWKVVLSRNTTLLFDYANVN